MKVTLVPVVIGGLRMIPKGFVERLELHYSIVDIGQNTKESPRNLRKLAVTQTLVKGHQLKLVWKARK